ncbi:MAG: hypothetical protein ABIV47_02990 [Roseiflexaceae bacterium]
MTHLQQTSTPNLANIPAELIARVQWVCWCYALDKNGKPTKIAYTPGTSSKASHSRPSQWRSFAEAVASYQARSDFFAGIGYVFSKDDPYVGGDIDHSLDMERVPPTYAELSPSGNGIKFHRPRDWRLRSQDGAWRVLQQNAVLHDYGQRDPRSGDDYRLSGSYRSVRRLAGHGQGHKGPTGRHSGRW